MDLEVARQRVALARVGRFATMTRQGRPHVVPCCFALEGEHIYSAVDAKPKTSLALRRLDNLTMNPKASLLVDHYSEDWTTLWWVRLDVTGRIAETETERERALDVLSAKFEQYRETTPVGPVIVLEIDRWSWWSAAS